MNFRIAYCSIALGTILFGGLTLTTQAIKKISSHPPAEVSTASHSPAQDKRDTQSPKVQE